MQMSQFRPASEFAKRYGMKAVIYGGPGAGKTPMLDTAPRPMLCATEPGLLSMRASNLPTVMAETSEKIFDFLEWLFKSSETKNFDTVCFDSISNMAEIILAHELKTVKHGMKAYGQMSEKVFSICNGLFYLANKHVVMLAKQAEVENGSSVQMIGGEVVNTPVMQKRPYFPGKDLNIKIPHLFDSVLHLGKCTIEGKTVPALRTVQTNEIFARERSGKLAELEPSNLAYIFNKALS